MPIRRSEPSLFRPEDYCDSGQARLAEARKALDCQLSGLALYLAGVSVECILRAHLPSTIHFDGRHDLARIGGDAGFFDPSDGRGTLRRDAVLAVVRRWRNNYRYMSDAKIARVLHAASLYPRLARRDVALVRMAAADAVNAADALYASCWPVRSTTKEKR